MTRSIAGMPIGYGDMYWNSPVDKLPMDWRSPAIIAALGAGRLGPCPEFVLNLVDHTTPVPAWTWDQMSGDFDNGAYPLTPTSQVSRYQFGATSDVSKGPYTPEDAHVLSLHAETGILYEVYGLQSNKPPYHAATGSIIDLRDYRLRTATKPPGDSLGLDNGTAAGLPIWPLVLTYDEVYGSDPIVHACRLALSTADCSTGYTWPATHSARCSGSNPLFSGACFRLRPDFDLTVCQFGENKGQPWPAWFVRVLVAFQRYGLYLTDFGTRGLIGNDASQKWGDPNSPTSDVWKFAGWLHGVQLADLQLIDQTPRMISLTSGQVNPAFVPR